MSLLSVHFDVEDDLTSERSREYKQVIVDALVHYIRDLSVDISDNEAELIKELIKE